MTLENKIVSVFGSSRPLPDDPDYEQARALGRALAEKGFQVCSGGYGGVMEAVSRGAKEAGGRTLAITAKFFRARPNAWVDEERAVESWEERLFELIRMGDGYVACKGGTGTLVELAVVWEMLNKGVMAGKPFATLGEFWTPILERVREVEAVHGSKWGEAAARIIHIAPTPDAATEFLGAGACAARTRSGLRSFVSRPAEEILEFDRLRDLLRGHTTSAPGQRAVDALAFRTDRAELDREFAAIAEAMACLRAGNEVGFGALADPQPWLARISMPGALLEPAGLLDVASLADTSAWLKDFFREAAPQFPLLAGRARSLADFRPLAAAIRRAILPNGEISDDASPALRRIRAGIARTRETIQKTMEQILRGRGPTGEDYVTRRNERFVIPVRASERHAVDGVIHAASASGQTVFVEPLAAIEFNNRLVQLSEEEAAEIARILDELTQRVAAEHAPLSHAVATIADMDSLFARGRFARQFDACIPEFAASAPTASLRPPARRRSARVNGAGLDAARHPVLESTLRPQGRAVVPMTLALGGAETVLVISGPNTGGKTVALKTVGLAVLSAQSGIPVAAQSARLSLFDRVLADIGDEQSIAADLSTFSAHMLNLKSMLGTLTEQSLVLVDEMGTGTAPEEGAALAIALLDEFLARRCLVLATTHHDRLKTYASTTPGVLNAAVEFDEERLAPTYRLRVGVPGGSSGIAIARAWVCRRASSIAPAH